MRKALKGALMGGLVGGGVGFGIPASYHAAKGDLTAGNALSSGHFGLATAIPGAIIGALLSLPTSREDTPGSKIYLGSPTGRRDPLYKDLIDTYNEKSRVNLTEEEFNQMYS